MNREPVEQENGESMWVYVPEPKSQIKIEQQPYDDSMTVKHLQRRQREKERMERERERGALWAVRDI